MRLGAILLLILLNGQLQAQTFTYPTIVEKGNDDSAFIPKGWKLLKTAVGDLNRDGVADLAFVIQSKDSAKLVKSAYDSYDTVKTQPRMLVIAFYNSVEKNYKLEIQNSTFILNHDNPYRDDPFDDLSISNGVLSIDFHLWFSWGTYEMSRSSYKFRYQNYTFELIEADSYSLHRANGDTESRSYNFVTGRVKTSIGNMSGETQNPSWRKFQVGELKTFGTFKVPYTFEVEKSYYL
jgi:hypothetical protein